jgi:UDP-3-O-[3-hydroxymyristoyl] N-acetylglucosamine deacetylase
MLSGYGLHSGVFSEVHLHRTEGGVRFLRNGTEIPARLECVIATPRCTILGKDNKKIALVEHLLAALHVAGWWEGVLIEVSGEEIPILDGSAQEWVEEVRSLGTPPVQKSVFKVNQSFSGEAEEQGSRGAGEKSQNLPFSLSPPLPFLSVEPATTTKLSVSVNYDHPSIGSQTWEGTPETYAEVLSARTFGFLKDYEMLRKQGLASHVGLENAIVFDENGTLSPLRFRNEPVRHKALDVLGDFFLLGKPLSGSLSVERGSHAAHVAFMKQLLAHDIMTEVDL